MDEIAAKTPDKIAIVWCDENGNEATFTFGQLKEYSNKAANFFKRVGVKKGDPVMLILKRRYEFWFAVLALHKIGAVAIPATHLLTAKDIIYRNNAADIKMIFSIAEDEVIKHIEDSLEKSPTVKVKALINSEKDGWYNFNSEIEKESSQFERPTGENAPTNESMMLLYLPRYYRMQMVAMFTYPKTSIP